MKVFACINQNSYGGGLILVAARTKEEAFSIASMDEDTGWFFYERYDKNLNPIGITSDTYPLDKWFEMEHLSTDLVEPKVIIEDHYSE